MSKKEKPADDKKDTEKQELVNHLQRLQADFDNYRKRTETELVDARNRAGDNLIKDFLPAMDNLQLAIDHADKSSKEELLKGVLMVQEQILKALEEQGVQSISTEGKFNPELHEAMLTADEGKKPGEILHVLQRGYTRNGRTMRPAKVSVQR